MKKLKPCPFCGGKAYIQKGLTGISMILCEKCGATVSFYRNEKEDKTIKCWNSRANKGEFICQDME